MEWVVLNGIIVWAVAGDVDLTVVGNLSTIVNVVDAVTSMVVPDTVTIYSSGLKVDASTSKDQRLNPSVPGLTFTVPADPENSAL